MKIILVLLLIFSTLIPMDHDDELHPKYHINNSVVFLQKSQDQKEKEITQDVIEKQWQNANRHTPINIATIDTGVSNRFKVAIALIGSCSTLTAAIISAIVTYYATKKC